MSTTPEARIAALRTALTDIQRIALNAGRPEVDDAMHHVYERAENVLAEDAALSEEQR